tara:strand:+ start:162450 stop:163361 length:912 start_codon:yes stop_codon:yes gene_type:complete
MYIALSGIDGCGKSTASRAVVDWLEHNQPKEIVFVHEYSGTPEADAIRHCILESDTQFTLKQQLLLIAAARDSMQEKLIGPALMEDKHIVSDRCLMCSEAYQVDSVEQRQLFDFLHQGIYLPDIIILVDLDVDTADMRIGDRERDNIEKKGKGYQSEVRERFLDVAKKNPFCIKVSSHGSQDEVYQDVQRALTEATISMSPLAIVIVNGEVTYFGSNGFTTVHLDIVYEALVNYGYMFTKSGKGLWSVSLGYNNLGDELLHEHQAVKIAFSDAIRRGYWNESFSRLGDRGKSSTKCCHPIPRK